ncbi:zinc finger homeobox protein 2 isoform X2 [Dunckerocampus dactyliophorus]|uniref:zinc finger homeobox protein 2 isoform X2 n=1 Tax=Dunckerocampus dactyliophorus TaxID=161453 RepID=UPI00240557AC|nr:zinc finger homeobox protein 2 isoform X2 [Dunckerocampus dactyliophorus]
MQEESGEKASSNSNGTAEWLCPLCQKGQADRASLSQHLTDQHSVLPTCLDKLLDISVLKREARQEERKGALISSAAVWTPERPSEDIASQPYQPSSDATHRDKEMEEDRMLDEEGGEAEPQPEDEANEIPEAKRQNASENEGDGSPKSAGKNGVPGENNTLSFKCSACLETFPSRTALSVHYYSASHIQKMTTIQSGEADSQSPSAAAVSRPYVSNKPYQCAVCRVSYNHSITLESHLKSVLHQTRSRSAANSSVTLSSSGGSTSSTPNTTVSTASGSSQLAAATTTNCATPGTMMVTTAGDAEQIQTSQAAPSLITPPVASAQAVSAFLTLLTSSPSALSHPLIPSLYAPGGGADAAQIVPQPHMVMPLILNGLQAQQAQQCPENQQGQLLTPCVPFVGLNAAQQALLTQRLSMLQHQWPPVAVPANTPAAPEQQKQSVKPESSEAGEEKMFDGVSIKTEEPEEESCPNTESKEKIESNEDVWKAPTDSKTLTDHVDMEVDKSPGPCPVAMAKTVHNNLSPSPSMPSNSSYSPVHLNLTLSPDSTPQKSQATASPSGSVGTPKSSPVALSNQSRLRCSNLGAVYPELPVLSEFQSEVLWAFFESRSEADAASPPREDCEALAREVGLSEEEVRKWLCQARYAKQRQRAELAHQQGLLGSLRATQGSDNDYDDEENSLVIAEEELEEEEDADDASSQAMDLSSTSRRRHQKSSGREGQGDSCLTSDSENEVYTSVIVTDEESQNEGVREAPESPVKEEVQREVQCDKGVIGGKVLRSTTVFLSDAEDDDDDDEGGGSHRSRKKKRKGDFEHEVEVKRERQDPDVDLELEAQADPPSSQPFSIDQIPSAALHSLPLSLTPFSTPFLSPYVLSLGPSLVGVGSKVPVFTNPSNVTSFSSSLLSQSLSSINQASQYLSNGGDCETALDLSMGKNNSSSSQADKISVQKGQLLDGLGLRPTSQGLVVVQVKPESLTTMTSSNTCMTLANSNNLTKSSHYSRPAEKTNAVLLDKEKDNEKDKERGQQQQRRAKGKRYHDMRRSRTIIQAEQLDILYGCYFKDPNPGKNEFEQIAEWVHLPKKVVQIWFQNMRARERKGEVRFISDGTLAAVGKPLIKFTWPLSKPIFSNKPVTNNTGSITTAPIVRTLIRTEGKPAGAMKKCTPVPIKPKEVVSSSAVSVVSSGASAMPKTKLETTSNVTTVKVASNINTPILLAPPKDPVTIAPRPDQQKQLEESEEEKTDEEEEDENDKGPPVTNRMVPKMTMTSINNRPVLPQKQNGLNYWTAKVPIKINTLSREQLGLPTHTRTIPPPPTPSIAPVSPNIPNTAKVARSSTPVLSKSSSSENSFLSHSSSRRPRTHLSCLQLYILQSCYETCAHPNAIECEALGTALNLPLKVVQIWFQNTRAKEKRWRLQQEKLSLSSGGKVDVSSGSYLHYNALKANRPILPKPVQLTFTESPASPTTGQSAPSETLTGCCNACKVSFKSGAAARAHVFSPHHLAMLRTTDFGQPTTLVNKNGTGSALASSGASSGIEVVIELPPSAATSNS